MLDELEQITFDLGTFNDALDYLKTTTDYVYGTPSGEKMIVSAMFILNEYSQNIKDRLDKVYAKLAKQEADSHE